MKYLTNMLACVVLLGCSSSAEPIANLKFEGIQRSNLGYEILFQSDVNIKSLYAAEESKKLLPPG